MNFVNIEGGRLSAGGRLHVDQNRFRQKIGHDPVRSPVLSVVSIVGRVAMIVRGGGDENIQAFSWLSYV